MSAPVVVGISGASGAAIGVEALRLLARAQVEVHAVVTEAGQRVIDQELSLEGDSLAKLAGRLWPVDELSAPIASGTFPTRGMIVAPCSIRTLSAVACCRSSNLLERKRNLRCN